eukprot:s679_g25.t3
MGKWNNDYHYHNDSWSVNKNHNQWKKSSSYHRQSSWHKSDRGDRNRSYWRGDNDNDSVSKWLTYVLRHGASEEDVYMDKHGYVSVDQLIALREKEFGKTTSLYQIRLVVETCPKQRFEIWEDEQNSGKTWVRATQGHSISKVQDTVHRPLRSADDLGNEEPVHGTFLHSWLKIRHEGLKTMGRNHIHMCMGLPGTGVISGMREDADVAIYINVALAMQSGICFVQSSNGVILTVGEGDTQTLSTNFFSKVYWMGRGSDSEKMLIWDKQQGDLLEELRKTCEDLADAVDRAEWMEQSQNKKPAAKKMPKPKKMPESLQRSGAMRPPEPERPPSFSLAPTLCKASAPPPPLPPPPPTNNELVVSTTWRSGQVVPARNQDEYMLALPGMAQSDTGEDRGGCPGATSNEPTDEPTDERTDERADEHAHECADEPAVERAGTTATSNWQQPGEPPLAPRATQESGHGLEDHPAVAGVSRDQWNGMAAPNSVSSQSAWQAQTQPVGGVFREQWNGMLAPNSASSQSAWQAQTQPVRAVSRELGLHHPGQVMSSPPHRHVGEVPTEEVPDQELEVTSSKLKPARTEAFENFRHQSYPEGLHRACFPGEPVRCSSDGSMSGGCRAKASEATTMCGHNMGQGFAPQAMSSQMNPQMSAQMSGQMNAQMNAHMNPQMNGQVGPSEFGGVQQQIWAEVAGVEEEYNTLAMPGMAQPNTGEVRAVPRAEPMNRLNTMNPMTPLQAREAKTQPDARQRAASPTKEAKDDSTGRRVELKANMKHQEVSTSQPSQPQIQMSKPLVNYQESSDESDESDGDYSETEDSDSNSDSDVEVVEKPKQAEAKEGSKDLDLALYFQKELGEGAAPVKGEASKVEDVRKPQPLVEDKPKIEEQRKLHPPEQDKRKTEDVRRLHPLDSSHKDHNVSDVFKLTPSDPRKRQPLLHDQQKTEDPRKRQPLVHDQQKTEDSDPRKRQPLAQDIPKTEDPRTRQPLLHDQQKTEDPRKRQPLVHDQQKTEDQRKLQQRVQDKQKTEDQRKLQPGAQDKQKTEDGVPSTVWCGIVVDGRPGSSFRALLFGTGEGAVFES